MAEQEQIEQTEKQETTGRESQSENGFREYNAKETCTSRRGTSLLCCWCCCLKGRQGADNMEMGYLPANITVNQGALQQGVPDIFLRNDSQSGRISMEPPPLSASGISFQISRDPDSGTETSATWADFLRRATLRRSGKRHYVHSDEPAEDDDSLQVMPSDDGRSSARGSQSHYDVKDNDLLPSEVLDDDLFSEVDVGQV